MPTEHTDLADYGFTENRYPSLDIPDGLTPGRVTAAHRGLFTAVCPLGELSVRLRGSFMHGAESAEDYPAVGDFVLLRADPGGQSLVERVLPRFSKFSRPDYSGHAAGYVKTILEQVVAANFDWVFIMTSLNNDYSAERVERYLAAAWQSGAQPAVLLTKSDLRPDSERYIHKIEGHSPGTPVFAVSAFTGEGLGGVRALLSPGVTAIFLGMSGVGKSTLVNALAGQELMDTREIREDDGRGRHTTTHRELIRLPSGALVIDTPGMRELSLWDADDGLDAAFSDVTRYMEGCRFSDCKHESEPGCAFQQALCEGLVTQERYEGYLKLRREAGFTNDKAAYAQKKREVNKNIAKFTKSRGKSTW